jgi:ribosomal protein S18 acetylase RimI-like enzyme
VFGFSNKTIIRPFLGYDLAEMAAIELRCRGGPDAVTRPWTLPRFLEFDGRGSMPGETVILVAEVGRDIAGHICYEYGDRRIDLVNLVVDPDHRRRGIGRALLARPLSRLTPGTFQMLVADVDDREETAHFFLRSCGLRARIVHGADGARDRYRFERHALEMGDALAAQNCPAAGEIVP